MHSSSNIGCGTAFFAVTPHDTNKLASPARLLYIGVGGDVVAKSLDGNQVTFKAAAQGSYLYGDFSVILATGTTATNLIGVK